MFTGYIGKKYNRWKRGTDLVRVSGRGFRCLPQGVSCHV